MFPKQTKKGDEWHLIKIVLHVSSYVWFCRGMFASAALDLWGNPASHRYAGGKGENMSNDSLRYWMFFDTVSK